MEIDFGDFNKTRKTLLITSFIGIIFRSLVYNSTGNIQMFGFNIPIENVAILPKYIGGLIIYLMIALVIRFFEKRLKELKDYLNEYKNLENYITLNKKKITPNKILSHYEGKIKRITKSILILDVIFPIVFGFIAISITFSGSSNSYNNKLNVSQQKIKNLEIELEKCDTMLQIFEKKDKIIK